MKNDIKLFKASLRAMYDRLNLFFGVEIPLFRLKNQLKLCVAQWKHSSTIAMAIVMQHINTSPNTINHHPKKPSCQVLEKHSS